MSQRERDAITLVPGDLWQVAIDTVGQPRTSRDEHGRVVDAAQVADITDLIRTGTTGLKDWPDDMRIIARRERPHPGAQLSLFEQHAGWRYQLTATNVPDRLPTGHINAILNNLAYLDALARSHARVEDRIRCAKSCGLGKFPSFEFARNKAWLSAASLAQTLLAWFAHLGLDGDLAKAEPATIRYRLLHVAARLTRGQRRRYLRIDETWPWTSDLITAVRRIQALPAGPQPANTMSPHSERRKTQARARSEPTATGPTAGTPGYPNTRNEDQNELRRHPSVSDPTTRKSRLRRAGRHAL